MIIGTGIDIIELQRIEAIIKRQPRFVERILTKSEQKDYLHLKNRRKIEFLAGRFAAKEAFVKAVGVGMSSSYGWQDIEVKRESNGKPYIVVTDYHGKIHLSISHSALYAVASVITESLPS